MRMIMAKTPKSKPAKKSGRPRLETLYVRYEIQITKWDFSWSYYPVRPSERRQGKIPFKEIATLTLEGRVVEPEGFKYPQALLRIVADSSYVGVIEQPKAVGSVQITDNFFTAYVFIPSNQMPVLVSAASSLRFIELSGTPLRYRKALIDALHLNSAPD